MDRDQLEKECEGVCVACLYARLGQGRVGSAYRVDTWVHDVGTLKGMLVCSATDLRKKFDVQRDEFENSA